MHKDFILSNISNITDEAFRAISSLESNIATFPLCKYILQTIFLRLTGYQEQKLKCILWELASSDFHFRYEYLRGNLKYGECSSLKDKNSIYKKLVNVLDEKGCKFPILTDDEKKGQLSDIRAYFDEKFGNSLFVKWLPRDYSRFLDFSQRIELNFYFTKEKIFEDNNILKETYENTYDHRNRCAHNLLCYQKNTPSLDLLMKDKNGSENYFSRMFILFLIDNVFTTLFQQYCKVTRKIWD